MCRHELAKKNGKAADGRQRYKCLDCGTRFVEKRGPLGAMRIDTKTAATVLSMLCEGSGVRAVSRITGVDKATVCKLLALIGDRCKTFMDREFRNLHVNRVQVDEVWQFVGCKQKTAERLNHGPEVGDAWLFTALEQDTKLLVCWQLSKRGGWDFEAFLSRLATATQGKFQLSTDAHKSYPNAVSRYLHGRVSYGQVVKNFGNVKKDDRRRYSPATIVSCHKQAMFGEPDNSAICTSHVERHNLTLRTCLRRMTRLTVSFSKKWENHEAAVALFMLHYNYCRRHATLKTTPAVAHGLADKKWTVAELIERTAPR